MGNRMFLSPFVVPNVLFEIPNFYPRILQVICMGNSFLEVQVKVQSAKI
jgi:hypothetical protein